LVSQNISPKIKFLLADDENLCQMAVANFAKRFGAEIDIANNGKEAVEKAKSNFYNFILMDMIMPEMNGFQAAEEIRKHTENGKDQIIIALSGGRNLILYF
jgi:CheY-like chemotaxis protein